MAKGNRGGKRAGGQTPTNAVQVENMNEAQLIKEIAKSDRKLQRLQNTMNANQLTMSNDGLIPINQLNGYNDSNKTSAKALSQADKQITATVNQASRYTKASNDYNSELKRNKDLNNALKTVKGTGKTLKQINDDKVKKTVNDTVKKSTTKWTKTTQQGQFGSKITIRTSGEYMIRSTGSSNFIYKNGKQLGMANTLKKAMAMVDLYKNRG